MSAKGMLLASGSGLLLTYALLTVAAPPAAVQTARPGLPEPRRLRSPVFGPSGIACDAASGRLFVVGDRGHVAELDREGRERSVRRIRGDLEDVTVLGDGTLLVLDESAGEIFRYDYDRGREQARWSLDVEGLLGTPRAPITDNGFEGLAFVADASGGAAGLLYLAHQHRPALIVVASFDPRRPSGTLGAESVRARWDFEPYGDVKAITHAATLDRFLAVSDAADRLIVLASDGSVTGELSLPGRQQEGACLDAEGMLWIADDRSRRLLAFPQATDALAAATTR